MTPEYKEHESFEEYKSRLYFNKIAYGLTWAELAMFLNSHPECPEARSGDYYRRDSYKKTSNRTDPTHVLLELKKLRQHIADEKQELKKLLTEDHKLEVLRQEMSKFATRFTTAPFSITEEPVKSREAILLISDWHYGNVVSLPVNQYNRSSARNRVEQLTSRVISLCKEAGVNHLYLLNLGDLISGRIHYTLQIKNECSVVEQVMEVSNLLANMLAAFMKAGIYIDYYSCVDNHSRLEPNKELSIEEDNFYKLIDWYLQACFSPRDELVFHKNEHRDIITFKTGTGVNVAAVHGHKDSDKDMAQTLDVVTRTKLDLILYSHYHHFTMNDNMEKIKIGNGSLMGTDTYAWDKRLHSRPSQTLIVTSSREAVESVHRITLV